MILQVRDIPVCRDEISDFLDTFVGLRSRFETHFYGLVFSRQRVAPTEVVFELIYAKHLSRILLLCSYRFLDLTLFRFPWSGLGQMSPDFACDERQLNSCEPSIVRRQYHLST